MTDQFMARIGGESAVFPSIVVRYSLGTYRATAKWGDYSAHGEASERPNEYTASEAAVRAAWSAHVKLFRKVCEPRKGEDTEFWAAREAEHSDPARYTAIVVDSTDSRGGYVVVFMDRCDVVPAGK